MVGEINPSHRPYKFLDYYDFQDRSIFLGRSRETEILLADVVSTRMVVLFAPTGTGKSSLINAGVRPRLQELDYRTLYVRVEKDPAESIRRELRDAGFLSGQNDRKALTEQLTAAASERPVVVFLDQFEEFFIHLLKDSPDKAMQFVSSVAELHKNRDSGVYFVFSMREEFFVKMNLFRKDIPTIFHNDSNLQLRWFDRDQAREIITEPPKRFGTLVDPDLVEQLLEDLGHPDGIEPARLQIVCDTLWRERSGEGLSLKLYQSLGAAKGIIGRRFEDDIAHALDDAELDLFGRMVPHLGTEYGTKTSQAFTQLAHDLAVDKTLLAALVEKLKDLHLVRENSRSSELYIEWTTDYLSDRARSGDWQARVQSIAVRNILNRALEARVLDADGLDRISDNSPLLTTLTVEEARLLFEASIEYGRHMSLWFRRALDAGVSVWNLIREILLRPTVDTRVPNAISLLSGREEIEAANLLAEVRTRKPIAEAVEDALIIMSRGSGPAADKARTLRLLAREPNPARLVQLDPPLTALRIAPEQQAEDWNRLLRAVRAARCTPILGAGLNMEILPAPSEIAERLASEFDYPFNDSHELARVSEYASTVTDSYRVRERLSRLLKVGLPADGDSWDALRLLAELPFSIYLTVNYDDLLEETLRRAGKSPTSEVCFWASRLRGQPSAFEARDYRPSVSQPLVFHLHGLLDSLESLVLTESDHIEFLLQLSRNPRLLPPRVQEALANSTLLILGHGLQNFRSRELLLGLSRVVDATRSYRSVMVNTQPGIAGRGVQTFFEAYARRLNMSVWWGTPLDFAREFRSKWQVSP
jgi:hypothetical protein